MVSLLQSISGLANTLEDTIASLRLHGSRDIPALDSLIPKAVLQSAGINTDDAKSILDTYLEQTSLDYAVELSDNSDWRTSKDPVKRQMTLFPNQSRIWRQQVYTTKRTAVDRALRDAEERIQKAVADELKLVAEKLEPALEYDDLGQLETVLKVNTAGLAPELRALRHRLYDTVGLRHHDDPELLYQLCFQTVINTKSADKKEDREILSFLEEERIPQDLYETIMGRQLVATRKPATEPLPPKIVAGPLSSVQVRVDGDHLVFENIVCHDADGAPTEQYPSLRVMRNVYRDANGKMTFMKPYEAIVHAQEQGDFNPSSQLATALVIAAYRGRRGRQNADVNAFLEQYKEKGNSNGYHVLNTITQWQGTQARLIHYPHLADFPEANRGTRTINLSRPHRVAEFPVDTSFGDKLVSEVSAQSQFGRYLRNWYGQPELGIIVEIGDHFSKPAKAWVPNNPTTANYTSGAWLRCSNNHFGCDSYYVLYYTNAFRGVR